MGFNLPIFIRTRDSGDVVAFSSIAEMQRQLEKIDIENNEYEAWDAGGRQLLLSLAPAGPEWLGVEALSAEPKPEKLSDAIRQFAHSHGLEVDLSGLSRHEYSAVLVEVAAALERKRQSKSWLSRFLSRF
jgi:hypothetical protein